MITHTKCPDGSLTTVIGLGNEFLCDDGIGIIASRKVAERLPEDKITFQELSVGGLELLDHLIGYDRCIIVDALATGSVPPGTIVRFTQSPGSESKPIASSHQIDLNQVLTLAHLLGAEVPRTVAVYGIEAADITTFGSALTPDVARSVPALVDAICSDLNGLCPMPVSGGGGWEILNQPVAEAASSDDSSSFIWSNVLETKRSS